MKTQTKNLILVVILLLCAHITKAQKNDSIICINFKSNVIKIDTVLPNKSKFVIKISGINRNLYKIDGVKTETDYNTTLPAALTGIKLPAYLYTSIPGNSFAKSPSITKGVEAIFTDLKRINDLASKLDSASFLYNDLSHLLKNCEDNNRTIIDKAKKITLTYIDSTKKNSKFSDVQMADLLERKLKSLRKEAESIALAMHISIVAYGDRALAKIDSEYVDAKNKLVEHRRSLKVEGTHDSAERNKLLRFIDVEQKLISNYPKTVAALPGILDLLKQNEVKALALIDDMRKFEKDDKIFAVVKALKLLMSPSTFEFTSEVMTAKTDEIKYVITIEPTELNTCDNIKKTIEVKVKVNGGWKTDFSTGLFVNSGSGDFLGQTYYYQNIDDTHRQIITADRGSRALLSVGALMHIHHRSPHYLNYGGSVGISTTAALTDLLFHIGPSLILGHEDRVVLSGGLTLKSVAMLDQKLQTNTTYTKLQSPDTIPTVTVFPKTGWFLSITYNFTKLKASK